MAPVFTQNGIEQTRDFFNRYVIGAGAIPAIRIGTQPYGILPATTISRMNWIQKLPTGGVTNLPGITAVVLQPDPTLLFLRRLYPILKAVDEDWRGMLGDVSFVGKPGGDPHRILLDVIGLHSGSVEWSQRYAESLKTLFNRLNLQGLGGFVAAMIVVLQRAAAKDLIRDLGGDVDPEPHIFEKIFSGRHNALKGGVVDDKPLSETELIRAYTETDSQLHTVADRRRADFLRRTLCADRFQRRSAADCFAFYFASSRIAARLSRCKHSRQSKCGADDGARPLSMLESTIHFCTYVNKQQSPRVDISHSMLLFLRLRETQTSLFINSSLHNCRLLTSLFTCANS